MGRDSAAACRSSSPARGSRASPRPTICTALGASVTVDRARDRVGGRVWTIRDGFAEGQHAEAGGDMIDEGQHEIRDLARELGLTLTRILRGGFGYVTRRRAGKPRIVDAQRRARVGSAVGSARRPDAGRTGLRSSGGTRRSPPTIGAPIGRRVARRRSTRTTSCARRRPGLRGFFLADPEELSLIALVDQFADADSPAAGGMYRIDGGNDRLAHALAAQLGDAPAPQHGIVAVSHRGAARARDVKNGRAQSQITCDYAVLALPATLLRRIPITPALPAQQHDAIARLKYGRATKTLLQFSQRFWRAAGAAARVRLAAAVRRGVGRQRRAARTRRHPRAARRRRRQRRDAGDRREARAARPGRRARLARIAARRARRVAPDRLGARSATRAAATRSSIPASIRRSARGSRGRAAVCSSPASTPASSGRAT